jgi:small subunit ribosomal protein S1
MALRFPRNTWPQPGNCFIMMPFGEKTYEGEDFNWDEHYKEVIEPTIQQIGMTPLRADGIFGASPLLERLWQGIQAAEIIIADLTGRSPNVLYELGLAHVIGKRILILTRDPEDVPVDLRQFVQISYSTNGSALVQFTRKLQKNILAARDEPVTEAMLTPLPGVGGSPEEVPATVIHVTPTFATVRTQDGRLGILSPDEVSWTRRVRDLTTFRDIAVGKELKGAFVVDLNGQSKYSLIALEENPWPRFEADYPIGGTFRGMVVNYVPSIGAFVDMKYKIHGLIPRRQLSHDLAPGTEVRFKVERIDSRSREVSLQLEEVIIREGNVSGWGPFTQGQTFEARIMKVEQAKGYLLVKASEQAKGILHQTRMSPRLRERFHAGELSEGDYLPVEIIHVNYGERKLAFRDRILGGESGSRAMYEEEPATTSDYQETYPA